MMQTYDYKEEIIASRKGFVGGSDGAMLKRIAKNGCIQKADYERMAIAKGLWQKDNVTTMPMRYGDYIENQLYKDFLEADSRWKNNLRYESKKYKRPNIGLLVHIDFSLQDDEKKKLTWIECKATSSSVSEAINEYFPQLWIEYNLGMEMAKDLGYEFDFQVIHYRVKMVPEKEADFSFNCENVRLSSVDFPSQIFDIKKAMDVINEFLPTMTEYYRDDIDFAYLPEPVKNELVAINDSMTEMKEIEKKIDAFKKKMYEFLLEKDIKSIKTPFFTISRVDPSISMQFDSKKYQADHPKLYKRYLKQVNKKGYAVIKLKGGKKNESDN